MSTCFLCKRELPLGRTKWCSKNCRDKWRGSVPSVKRVCTGCGAEYLVPIARVLKRKFCTLACAYRHRNMAILPGSQNPNWRGGRALSYGPNWKTVKAQVRARDL